MALLATPVHILSQNVRNGTDFAQRIPSVDCFAERMALGVRPRRRAGRTLAVRSNGRNGMDSDERSDASRQ
jgi:hypothetical protein